MVKNDDRSQVKSVSIFDRLFPVVTALIGVAAGSAVTLLTAGHIESVRLAEMRKSQSVAAYVEAAWGGSKTQDHLDFTRKLSLLSVYASKGVIDAVRAYQATDCASKGDPPGPCRELWAKVVGQLRAENGGAAVPGEDIIELIWGKQ